MRPMMSKTASAPKLGKMPHCCSCSCGFSEEATSTSDTFCSLHQSWLKLQQSLIDKEYEVHSLNDKVSNLEVYQTECHRKDEVVTTLRQENVQLQKHITEKDLRTVQLCEELESLKKLVARKDEEISNLSDDYAEMNSKFRSNSRHRESLQSQLALKTDQLSSHCQELTELKKEKRLIQDSKSLADDSNKEKKATISSLQERIKHLKSTNQGLQSRVENAQSDLSQLRETEKALCLELNQQKTKHNQVKLQLDNTLKQLSELQTINLDIATRSGESHEEFDHLCHQLRNLTGLHTATKNNNPSDDIITAVSSLIKEQLRIKQELAIKCQELKEAGENFSSLQHSAEQISKCLASMKDEQSQAATVCKKLEHISAEEEIQPLKASLLDCLSALQRAEHKLSLVMTTALSSLALCGDETTGKEDVNEVIQCLSNKLEEYHKLSQTLEERIKCQVSEHNRALDIAIGSVKQEYEARTREAVELAQTEERNIRKHEIDKLRTDIEAEKEALKLEHSAIVEMKTTELKDVSSQLKAKEERINELEDSLKELLAQNSTFSVDVVKLQEKIALFEIDQREEETLLRAMLETKQKEYEETIYGYKIQNQEHAQTIVSMESKLLAQMDAHDKMNQLQQELQDKINELQAQLEAKNDVEEAMKRKPLTRAGSAKICKQKEDKQKSSLKRQLTLANTSLKVERKCIEDLQQKMTINQEAFKKELESVIASHQTEIQDLNTSLAEKEQTVVYLTNEVKDKTTENVRMQDELKQRAEEQSKLLEKLAAPPVTAEANTDEASISVMAIGQRCIGENHEQVIKSQSYALNEMRKKINELLTTNPPVPSHQAALKELAKLRQEVVHLRAEDVIRKEAVRQAEQERQKQVLTEIKEAKVSDHEAADVKEALKESEEAYSQLLTSVCDYLSIAQPPAFQSLHGRNKVARSIILKDREIFLDNRLKESISLLKKCYKRPIIEEDDVQEATPTGEPDKQATLSIAQPDLTHLGVYSSGAMEDLDKEKRLLHAITKRQEFKQKQNKRKGKQHPSHSCLLTQEEVDHKVGEVRKVYNNRIHKKDVEITQLKSKLNSVQLQNTELSSKMKVIKSNTT